MPTRMKQPVPDTDAVADDSVTPRQTSRRSFFFLGALAAASTLAPKRLHAQRIARPRTVPRDPALDEFPMVLPQEVNAAPAEWASNEVRLVRRITMGVTYADVMRARLLGYQGYLNWQLNYTRIPDDVTAAVVASRYPQLSQTGDQLYTLTENNAYVPLQEGTIYRAAFSQRQLYERMVEFWTDHFNIDMTKVGYLKILDDREVIRKHALGNFYTLLKASAHSAAMMAYLDQNLSRVGRPNQNYARELMELHTLGVDGGYTQDDVAELSRVLTGWTVQGRGNFFFDSSGHDFTAKTVMGMTIPASSTSIGAGAIQEGEQILDMLLRHPNTARFIATKMLKWLLTPDPSELQISTIASVYKATSGDIKSMVRAILNESWLPAAPLKFKRPFHFVVSSLRSLNPVVTSLSTMNSQLSTTAGMGMPPFLFETPDGYPDKIEYWAGNILLRWSFGNTILNARSSTTTNADITRYLAGTPDAAIDLIDQDFFGGELDATTRLNLLTYLRGGTFGDTRMRETLALAISSSKFQWY